MSNVITAEFDSLDLAEIAASRIRHQNGIEDIKISKNRFSRDNHNDVFEDTPAILAPTLPLNGGYSNANIAAPVEFTASGNSVSSSEIGKREEAYITVHAEDMKTARSISASLTSSGGRKVRIIENI